jgi:WD40 repeat protein
MLPPLRGHNGGIYSVAISPDGSKIISGSQDRTIRIWDASTGKTIRVWVTSACIEMLAFSPDGSKIISESYGFLQVWDASTGEMFIPRRGLFTSFAFSPDGSKTISGSWNNIIQVWDARTGIEVLPPLRGHKDRIHSLVFSPDGSKIISESPGAIRVWDASTGVMLPRPQIPADDSPMPAMDELIIPWDSWFTNINGRYMGALPIGTNLYSYTWKTCGSTYVGWTEEYQLVLIHFPEQ